MTTLNEVFNRGIPDNNETRDWVLLYLCHKTGNPETYKILTTEEIISSLTEETIADAMQDFRERFIGHFSDVTDYIGDMLCGSLAYADNIGKTLGLGIILSTDQNKLAAYLQEHGEIRVIKYPDSEECLIFKA